MYQHSKKFQSHSFNDLKVMVNYEVQKSAKFYVQVYALIVFTDLITYNDEWHS